ncbi:MAG: c-type cytochrome [Acidimicrobiia bacterium]
MERTHRGLLAVAAGLLVWLSSCSSAGTSAPDTASPTTSEPTTTRAETTLPPTTAGEVTTSTAQDLVALGMSLSARNGCAVCHSADGSPLVGPTWLGLFGTTETLTDGSTVVVDEAYIRESILDPNVKIVEGFPPDLMPKDFADKLSDDDITAITEYMKSLG